VVLAPVMDGSKDGSTFQFWKYNGPLGYFQLYTIDSATTFGIGDSNDNDITDYNLIPTLAPGTGFLYGGPATTLTFVGSITPGTFNNTLAGAPKFTLASSIVPISGGLVSTLKLPFDDTATTLGSTVQFWTYNGPLGFWKLFVWDDQGNAGDPQFYDSNDANPVAEPTAGVGTSFLVGPSSASAATWTQTLSP